MKSPKILIRAMMCTAVLCCLASPAKANQSNVIFFALDDLCDWVGPLGYQQAVTPHMDTLARSGVTFTNGHTAGTFCAPSRTAIFTGRHASSTGCYTTQVYFQDHPDIRPLQSAFKEGGYRTFGAGKLFHHPAGFVDLRGWDTFFVRNQQQKQSGWPLDSWSEETPIPQPYPNSRFNQGQTPANRFFLEWGKVPNEREEEMADTIRTNWACEVLRQQHDQPFFLALGLYTPHFPNYAPAKYFDLYDVEAIEPPPYKADDLEDLPEKIRIAKTHRSRIHQRLVQTGSLQQAIHGYLASVSYADAMLGRLMNTLNESPYADNTIVILWSDHGYHHGEKGDWGKHNLWERTSNVPLIWSGPAVSQGAEIDATVSLIDLYPTLVEMCSLPAEEGLDGTSLAHVLSQPATARDRNVLLPYMDPEGYAIINRTWRYIHYSNGTEELYNVQSDPHEWDNLAGKAALRGVIDELQKSAPKKFAPPGPSRDKLQLQASGEQFQWRQKKSRNR